MKAKKRFGQHFLHSKSLVGKIVGFLTPQPGEILLEIGPGRGIMTEEILLKFPEYPKIIVEAEREAYEETERKYGSYPNVKIVFQDILKYSFSQESSYVLIGNLPYNISSQIVFKVLENRELIREAVFMFQKEVAKRLTARPKSKEYGILSVLTQTYYDVRYLLEISPGAFVPPPKVKSAVIKFTRNEEKETEYEKLKLIVKKAFSRRRKMLRNNLPDVPEEFAMCRAEELSLEDYKELTRIL